MAFWLYLLALARRPRALVAISATAVLFALAAFFVVPTAYTSSATLVLTTSPTNEVSAAGDPNENPLINPLLHFDDGLNTALAIVVQQMNAPDALDPLALDPGTFVTVSDIGGTEFLGNKGPFLFITAQSVTSAEAAQDAVVRTEQLTRGILLERQQSLNAPESQLITPLIVVPPTKPHAEFGARTKGALGGFAAGALISLGVIYLRDRRRGAAAAAVEVRAATNGTSQFSPSKVAGPAVVDGPTHKLLAYAGNNRFAHRGGLVDRPDVAPAIKVSADPLPDLDATVSLPRYVPPDPDRVATERLVVVDRATENTNGVRTTGQGAADPLAEAASPDGPVGGDAPGAADAKDAVDPAPSPPAAADGHPAALSEEAAVARDGAGDTTRDVPAATDDPPGDAEKATDPVATGALAVDGNEAAPPVSAAPVAAEGQDDSAPESATDRTDPTTNAGSSTEAPALPAAEAPDATTARRRPDGTNRVGKRPRPRLAPPRKSPEEAAREIAPTAAGDRAPGSG